MISLTMLPLVQGLYAARDITKGSIIYTEQPEVSVQTNRVDACHRCMRSLVTAKTVSTNLPVAELWPKYPIVACSSCAEVVYCSAGCRELDWETGGHRYACLCAQDRTQSGVSGKTCWP